MDQKLRLVIDLQNRASRELQGLQKDLGGVKPHAGMRQTANWFSELESVSGKANTAMRPLIGGLNTVGVSGLAAGLSVAGLVSQFRDLAKAMPALAELSRQTGISATRTRAAQGDRGEPEYRSVEDHRGAPVPFARDGAVPQAERPLVL